MKMYDGVLKRVKQIEAKNGIIYATPDKNWFKAIKIIGIIAFSWTFLMNLFYAAGSLMIYSAKENPEAVYGNILPIIACTGVLIAGLVLCCCKKYLLSAILSSAASVVILVLITPISTDSLGFLGMQSWYYWRHLGPLAIIIIATVIMAIIAVRAELKVKKLYKKVVDNLFIQYGDVSQLSDEQWDEFLQNYDPQIYKRQFVKQEIKTDEG